MHLSSRIAAVLTRVALLAAPAVMLCIVPRAVVHAQAPVVDETQETAQGLLAVANRWSNAEAQGAQSLYSALTTPEP